MAIVGRPRARRINQVEIVEVLRLCTDGTNNACSFLYGACRRASKFLGYRKIITYILENESGVTLKAAGWRLAYVNKGGSWNVPSRPRFDKGSTNPQKLYFVDLLGGNEQCWSASAHLYATEKRNSKSEEGRNISASLQVKKEFQSKSL